MAGALEQMHIVVLRERLADYVVFYLLTLENRKHDKD